MVDAVLAAQATETLVTSSSTRASAESCQVTCRIVVYIGGPPPQVGMKHTACDHPPRCLLPGTRTKPWGGSPSLRTCLLDDRANGGVGYSCLTPTVDATGQEAQRLMCWYPEARNSDRPGSPRWFGMRTCAAEENVTDDKDIRPSACNTHVCTRKHPQAMTCS